jgi:cell wall-associated NlpC family hydrolase
MRVPTLAQARIGDLIFFGSPIHHVAIYVGRGMMLDAPHTGSFVQVRKVYQTPTVIRRVL